MLLCSPGIMLLEYKCDGILQHSLSSSQRVALDAGILHVHAKQDLGQADLPLLQVLQRTNKTPQSTYKSIQIYIYL